jgi:hypothetical protein
LSLFGFEDILDLTPLSIISRIGNVSFIGDSSNIFIADGNGNAAYFSLRKHEMLQRYAQLRTPYGLVPYEIAQLAVSSNGNRLGIQTANGDTYIYDRDVNEKWGIQQTLESRRAFRSAVESDLHFLDQNGEMVLLSDMEGNLLLWKLSNTED